MAIAMRFVGAQGLERRVSSTLEREAQQFGFDLIEYDRC
jgi:hypothetical protein